MRRLHPGREQLPLFGAGENPPSPPPSLSYLRLHHYLSTHPSDPNSLPPTHLPRFPAAALYYVLNPPAPQPDVTLLVVSPLFYLFLPFQFLSFPPYVSVPPHTIASQPVHTHTHSRFPSFLILSTSLFIYFCFPGYVRVPFPRHSLCDITLCTPFSCLFFSFLFQFHFIWLFLVPLQPAEALSSFLFFFFLFFFIIMVSFSSINISGYISPPFPNPPAARPSPGHSNLFVFSSLFLSSIHLPGYLFAPLHTALHC